MNDKTLSLLGAICGDVIGSTYELARNKQYDFELFPPRSRFTDDTVMTVAIADWILSDKKVVECVKFWGNKYPRARYGGRFKGWLRSQNPKPYYSFGNGSAMRVSAIGWAFNTLEEVLKKAEESAEITHNHPEGIKGAQAVASAIFLARTGTQKEEISKYIEETFNYNLKRSIKDIRSEYNFNVTCQGSVPEAIIAFLDSTDYESAVRNAVSLGGDADTQAAISGGIAAAFYGHIPAFIINETLRRLPDDLKEVITAFANKIID